MTTGMKPETTDLTDEEFCLKPCDTSKNYLDAVASSIVEIVHLSGTKCVELMCLYSHAL